MTVRTKTGGQLAAETILDSSERLVSLFTAGQSIVSLADYFLHKDKHLKVTIDRQKINVDYILSVQISALKEQGVITSVALGGWNDSKDDKYSRMVATKKSRKKFIDSAISFIETFGYQGLDLDWEYPVCWQVLF